MPCKEGGVAEVTPPRGSQVNVSESETAGRMIPAYRILARRLGPGQGPNGEPPMAGGVVRVIKKGGLRLGRSVRGEHRIDEGERQPLPTSLVQQI